MEINRLAFGTIAAACIAAAGGGAYLATRHNAAEQPAVVSSAPVDPTAVPSGLASGTEASEGVVTPAAPTAGTAQPSPVATTPSVPETPPVASPAPARQPSHRPAVSPGIARETRQVERDRSTAPPASDPAPLPAAQASAAPTQLPAFNPAPPEPQFQELVVSADQVIGLQVDTPLITSERARIEDKVEARVTRDVKVGDRVAIPAGAKAVGSVTLVDRGGKMRDRARLGIRFHTIVLADGTRLPIQTDAVFREGDAPGGEAAAKVGGGAIGGAIIGGILGGARGAILGGTAGAGAGTAAVMAGDRNPAALHAGETVTVRLMQPVTVTVDKE